MIVSPAVRRHAVAALALVVVAMAPRAAAAQQAPTRAFVLPAPPPPAFASAPGARAPHAVVSRAASPFRSEPLARTLAGAVGWAVGAIGGGLLAYEALPHCGGCEDPGLEQMLGGAVVGGVIGASLGAAAPRMTSGCRYGPRLGGAVLGSALAAGFAVLTGDASDSAVIVTVPLGTISGAVAGASLC